MKDDTTTIPLKKSTRNLLYRIREGETWDALINKLMKVYNESL